MFHFISVSPLFNLCFTSTIISSTFVSPLIPSSYLHYPFLLHLSFISVSSASPLIITSHLCFHFYLRHTLITLCCHLYLRKPHPRSTCVSPVSHLPPPPPPGISHGPRSASRRGPEHQVSAARGREGRQELHNTREYGGAVHCGGECVWVGKRRGAVERGREDTG